MLSPKSFIYVLHGINCSFILRDPCALFIFFMPLKLRINPLSLWHCHMPNSPFPVPSSTYPLLPLPHSLPPPTFQSFFQFPPQSWPNSALSAAPNSPHLLFPHRSFLPVTHCASARPLLNRRVNGGIGWLLVWRTPSVSTRVPARLGFWPLHPGPSGEIFRVPVRQTFQLINLQ